MKHHNLYRLTLAAYGLAALLVPLSFLMTFVAIVVTGHPFKGLAVLFGVTGVVVLVAGTVFHFRALEDHEELKPLPKNVRDRLDAEARNRRADLLLERAVEEVEERTRAIEGRVHDRHDGTITYSNKEMERKYSG